MLPDLEHVLQPLLADAPEGAAITRLLAATRWIAAHHAALATPDVAARQRAVHALHADWHDHPEHADALRSAPALLPDHHVLTDVLAALSAALDAPTPPTEASLGAALTPSLDAARDAGQAARDALVTAEIQQRIDKRLAGFTLPPLGGRS